MGQGGRQKERCSWWGVNLIVEKCGCWSPFSGRFVLLSKPFAPQSTPATPVASMCLRGAIGTHITAPEVIPTRAPALNTTQTPSQPYRLCGSVVLIMNLFFFFPYSRIALVTNRQASTVVPHFPMGCVPTSLEARARESRGRDPQASADEPTGASQQFLG